MLTSTHRSRSSRSGPWEESRRGVVVETDGGVGAQDQSEQAIRCSKNDEERHGDCHTRSAGCWWWAIVLAMVFVGLWCCNWSRWWWGRWSWWRWFGWRLFGSWSNAVESGETRWLFLAVVEFLLRWRESALLNVQVDVFHLDGCRARLTVVLHVVVEIAFKGLLERHVVCCRRGGL